MKAIGCAAGRETPLTDDEYHYERNVPTAVSLGLHCDSQPTGPFAGSALLD